MLSYNANDLKFWDTLTNKQQVSLEANSRILFVRKRQAIFSPGDSINSVYILRNGLVRIIRAIQRSKEITIAVHETGDIFGESTSLDDNTRRHYAEALLDSEIMVISKDAFQKALKNDSSLLERFVNELQNKRKTLEYQLEDLAFRDVPARLARVLLWLSEHFGDEKADGHVHVNLRLTHHELASLVGTTRETTTLVLNRFRKQGLISLQGRTLIITQKDMLNGHAILAAIN